MTEAPWQLRALCRPGSGIPPDTFFPGEKDVIGQRAAALVCSECPVHAECRTEADRRDERYGIWGGVNRDRYSGLAVGTRPPKTAPTETVWCGTDRGYGGHRWRNENPCEACRIAYNLAIKERRGCQ